MTSAQFFDLALSQTIQLSILIAAVGIITKFSCKRRPHLAYVLWMLVLIKAITPPLWSSPMGLFSWAQAQTPSTALPTTAAEHLPTDLEQYSSSPLPRYSSDPLSRYAGGGLGRRSTTDTDSHANPHAQAPPESPSPKPVVESARPPIPVNLILAEIWLSGFFFLLTMTAIKWGFLHRRIARCTTPPPADLRGVVEDVCRKLGVCERICLRVCAEPIGPAVFGFFRPILVLPESVLVDADQDDLRQLLSHEIIHIRRKDPWISALQVLVQSVWWFHPLVWWMNRCIGQVREMCCDSEVIATQRCQAARYAQMLLDVARSRRANRGFAVMEPALGASGARLTRTRLEYVMNEKSRLAPRMPAKYWAVFAICSLLVLPGAALLRGAPAAGDATSPTGQQLIPLPAPSRASSSLTPPSTQPATSSADLQYRIYEQDAKDAALQAQTLQLQARIDQLRQQGLASSNSEIAKLQAELKAIDQQSRALTDYARHLATQRQTRTRHFVMIVVAMDAITFQGEPISLDLLPNKLLDVPDPSHTVVQLAYANGDVTMRRFSEVQGRVGEIVKRLGFEYLSEAGEHPKGSKGDPDQTVESNRLFITSPAPMSFQTGDGNFITANGAGWDIPPVVTGITGANGLRIVALRTPAPDSELTHNVKFQLGKTEFTNGDEIVITEIRGTSDQFQVDGTYQVKGTYRLASHDEATLNFGVSAKNAADAHGSWGKWQGMPISKGTGTFVLTDRFPIEGYPHLIFNDDRSAFGTIYFGAGRWLLTDTKHP
jgi:beta-lactamase regulating signal transducer with metallopeptidase domain